MITVTYSDDGIPINDFKAEEFVSNIIRYSPNSTITISSEIALNYFRCYVAEGKLDKNAIKFVIDGIDTKIDKNGTLERYPTSSALDDSLERLLNATVPDK